MDFYFDCNYLSDDRGRLVESSFTFPNFSRSESGKAELSDYMSMIVSGHIEMSKWQMASCLEQISI